MGGGTAEETQNLTQSEEFEDDTQFLEEAAMREYKGTFASYSEAVLQFGFVSLFSCAMPILAVYALVENLLVLRLKAWRVCRSRRPHVELAAGIGSWDLFVRVISYMGVVWGVGIQIFAGSNFTSSSTTTKTISTLATVQLVLSEDHLGCHERDGAGVGVHPQERTSSCTQVRGGLHDDDDDLDLNVPKGTLDDNVDVDALNTICARARRSQRRVYRDGRAGPARALMKEVKTEEQLQQVYRTESFNDNTGVETKYGCLCSACLALIEIDGLMGEEVGPILLPGRGGEGESHEERRRPQRADGRTSPWRSFRRSCSVRVAEGHASYSPSGNWPTPTCAAW